MFDKVRASLAGLVLLAALAVAARWHLASVHAAEQAVHQHYAGVLAKISGETAAALAAFRQLETHWQKLVEKEAADGQARIDAAQLDAVAAHAAADRLREQLARYRSGAAARSAAPAGAAAAGQGQPGADPLDLLSGLLTGHTAELAAVGGYADQLRAAGLTCERIDDSLSSHQ